MPKRKLKTYRVDIQFTTEFSYDVEASSEDEAREKAQKEYESGEDTYIHSETFDSQITNCEELP